MEQVAKSSSPMLPRISAAVVLSMDTAHDRHKGLTENGDVLRNLCPILYMQCNQGFKACDKRHVTNTAHDLVHAYLNAFREMVDYDDVLIIEDDAQFDIPDLAAHLKRVDEFIDTKQGNYTAYTLGSFALAMAPCGWLHHRRIIGRWACTHAVIWSRHTRHKLLESIDIGGLPSDTILHLDNADMIPTLQEDIYTYYRPICTQLFPATENRGNWCLDCTNLDKPHRQHQEAMYRDIVGAFHRVIGVNQRTRPGWDIMYCGSFGLLPSIFIILLITLACIALCKVARRS